MEVQRLLCQEFLVLAYERQGQAVRCELISIQSVQTQTNQS